MNEYQRLGRIGEASLFDIWHGTRAADLRTRVAASDLTLGCERCAWAVDSGLGDSAYLHVFDSLAPDGPSPEWPRRLELALTNTCNLQCAMCNGELSSAIRSRREGRPPLPTVYDDTFFLELCSFLPHLDHITFLGGEPFLGREPLRVLEMLLEMQLSPVCHVTTNGTQWNARIREYLQAMPLHVAVSIDALSAPLASQIRVGVDHALVLANFDELRAAAANSDSSCSISFSLMRHNVHELQLVLSWADERDVDVTVNRVVAPARFSLALAPADELRSAIELLESQALNGGHRLTRNRSVWEQEVAWVRALGVQRTASDSDAQPGPGPGRPADAIPTNPQGWATTTLVADDGQVVRTVTTEQPTVKISFDALVGRSLLELVDHFQQHLGPVARTEIVVHPVGAEEHRLDFVDGSVRTQVRAYLSTTAGGDQLWTLQISPDLPL